MKKIANTQKLCTGCGACKSVCPKSAISMLRDRAGFLYPIIDTEKCIECGLYSSACHVNSETKRAKICAYYGYHKDNDIRMKSSSGGAFTALAQIILKQNGVIYAHILDKNNLYLHCVRAESESQLETMRGSKYVESDITGVFRLIKEDLTVRPVLFCGTPCQCAALRTLFGDNEKLCLVSFVCHGVGSPTCFQEHFSSICEKKIIIDFNMRDKTYGWHDNAVKIVFDGSYKKYLAHYSNDSYYFGFIALNRYLRDCCYSCQYTDNHSSDVIIADYWNIVNTNHQDDNKGYSMVIVNSQLGKRMIESLDNAKLFPLPLSDCEYAFWPCTSVDSLKVKQMIETKNEFLNEVENLGFDKAAKQYMRPMIIRRSKTVVKRLKALR